MIPNRYRFWAQTGGFFNDRDPETWHIIDWDLRRYISVTGPAGFSPEDEGNAAEALRPIVDDLDSNVRAITVTSDGTLVNCSTSSEDDQTPYVRYPRFTEAEAGDDHLDCLKRSQLTEVDRLHVCVDLVQHNEQSNRPELFVFKYAMLIDRLHDIWNEAFLMKRLKGHPNIVPFYKFIVDDVEPWLLGYTTRFIPNGTLEEQQGKRPLRKVWLQQLMDVVDDLNLRYGIVHQDIAPRNILIDPSTDNLMLFDFDRAVRVGSPEEYPERNDVKGVVFTLYEILTYDNQVRNVPHGEQDVGKIEAIEEWDVKAEVERGTDAKSLRSMVTDWARCRQTKTASYCGKPPVPLNWPPVPPTNHISWRESDGQMEEYIEAPGARRDVKAGERIVPWERMPYSKLVR